MGVKAKRSKRHAVANRVRKGCPMSPSEIRELLGCRLVPNVPGISQHTARYIVLSVNSEHVRVKHLTSERASTIAIEELSKALAARLLRVEPKG